MTSEIILFHLLTTYDIETLDRPCVKLSQLSRATLPSDTPSAGPLSRVGGTPMPHEVPAPSPVTFRQEPATDNLLDDDQWGSFSS